MGPGCMKGRVLELLWCVQGIIMWRRRKMKHLTGISSTYDAPKTILNSFLFRLLEGPHNEELRPPTNSHVSKPPWKPILQPVRSSGDCSPVQNLDCNLMRDPDPEPPS